VRESRLKRSDRLLEGVVIQLDGCRINAGRRYAEHAECLPNVGTCRGTITNVEDIVFVVRMTEVLLVALFEDVRHMISSHIDPANESWADRRIAADPAEARSIAPDGLRREYP
jgi:hypothetical protein